MIKHAAIVPAYGKVARCPYNLGGGRIRNCALLHVEVYYCNANMMLYEGFYDISSMNNVRNWKPDCKKLYDIEPIGKLLYQKAYKGALQCKGEFLHTNTQSSIRRQMTTVMLGVDVTERRGIL